MALKKNNIYENNDKNYKNNKNDPETHVNLTFAYHALKLLLCK